jgi:hypothetical protein
VTVNISVLTLVLCSGTVLGAAAVIVGAIVWVLRQDWY